MGRGARAAAAVVLTGALASTGVAAATPVVAPSAAQQDHYVRSIAVSPTYSRDHVVFASVTRPGCASCHQLLVSSDGALTWHAVRASGWLGGDVAVAGAGRGRVLASSAPDAVQVSTD